MGCHSLPKSQSYLLLIIAHLLHTHGKASFFHLQRARSQVSKSNPPQGVCLLLVSSSPYSPAHQPTAAQLHPGETPAAVPPHPPVRGQLMRPSSPPSKAHVPSTFASISDIPFAHILSCAFARFIPLLPLHLSTWCALGSPVLLSLDIIPLHLWYLHSHSPNYSYLTTVTLKFKSATLFPL